MALNERQYEQIRKELLSCEKPLIFFHDDADGLASFLLLRRFMKKGKGILVKAVPKLDARYFHYVEEYSPDKIFVVDVSIVEQEFIDKANLPIVWLDHHQVLSRHHVLYFNPRESNSEDSHPASYLCYKVVRQDLWIAMAGIVGDWLIPEFLKEFYDQYPDLFDDKIKSPGEALFQTKLGELSRIFSFILKGASEEALKCVNIISRIDSPYEILNQETPSGKYIYKRYKFFDKIYQELLGRAKKAPADDFLIFTYTGKDSFTGELSNELLYLNPEKVIITGRERQDEVRMSIRGAGKNVILPRLKKALEGIDGYGGGHEYACGATVKKHDLARFMENLRKEF
ncbi:MAG: DHH family phosphoesterase [Candidatus Woesearchaeota archaeon]